MTDVILYTTTDEIRAILGVTANEVKDEALVSMLLEKRLQSDLYGWLPGHAAVYAAGQAVGATDEEVNKQRTLQLFSAYFCASHVDFFQLSIPASIGDGKNILKRFEGIDFDALSAKLRGIAEQYKDDILDGVLGTPVLFGISVPDYDPVTNT
jgi:hypothetical protein